MKKTILTLITSFLMALVSTSAFALLLVPEANCRGVLNNAQITVSAHVPDAKFCTSARKFNSAVVIQGEGELPSIFPSINRITGVMSTHTSGEGATQLELIFHTDSGMAELHYQEQKIGLECDFIEYEIDC